MLNASKTFTAILVLGLTLSLTAGSAEAGRKGGFGGGSRGKSMGKSFSGKSMGRKFSGKSMGKRFSGKSNSIGNRTNQFKSNSNRFNNNFKNKNFSNNKLNNNRFDKKIDNKKFDFKNNKNINRFDKNVKNLNKGNFKKNFDFNKKNFNDKKFGFHKNNKHHWHHGHRHHFRGWYGWYRPVIWGIRPTRPAPVYCNPYCSSIVVDSAFGYPGQSGMAFDYSKPIPDQNNEMTEKGAQLMEQARQAFLAGNYEAASRIIAQAAQEMPKNHDVHQFRSLILFAMGDYANSAGAAHVALTGGPGWNWETLRSFYNDKETYTEQLRNLEETRKQSPEAAELRFLLGYHYLMMGHVESAAKELATAVELEPRDELSKKLLEAITSKTGKSYEADPVEEQDEVPAPPELPETETTEKPVIEFIGSFTASPAEGVTFKLDLKEDGSFVWGIENPEGQNEFAGTFEIEGSVITLTRENDGEKMIAIITPQGEGFNFKMQNGPDDDTGLNFQPAS